MILSFSLPTEKFCLTDNEPPMAPDPVTLNEDINAWPDTCKPDEGTDIGEYEFVFE